MANSQGWNATTTSELGSIWQSAPPPPPAREYRPEVSTYLFQSIAVTLVCCLPLGLVAIYYAAQVNSKLAAGDIRAAQEASNTARTWCWVALAGGLLAYAVWFLFIIGWGIATVPVA